MQWLWLCSVLMPCASAFAQMQPSDAELQSLTREVLDVDVSASLAEQQTPDYAGNIPFYVGTGASPFLLRTITVHIDDEAPVTYEYSDPEAHALQKNALQKLMVLKLAPGMHKLHADFYAADGDAKPGDPRWHGQLDTSFGVDNALSALELDLVKRSFIRNATMNLVTLQQKAWFDAQLRAADFLAAEGRHFSAASELLRLQIQNPDLAQSENFRRNISENLRALHLQDRIPKTESTLAAVNPDISGIINSEDTLLARYNQATDALKQGKNTEGRAALDAIGRVNVTDSVALSVRDQANLVLGYELLRNGLGSAAIPVFSRIRSPGPCANPALLGLGWSLLAPVVVPVAISNGNDETADIEQSRIPTLLTPHLTADIAALRRLQPPQLPHSSKDEQIALHHALVPWSELTGRDPTDPAVQEGMLATAWALYHLGAYEQAQDDYLRAIDQFEKTRGWFDAAIQNVRTGDMATMIEVHENDDASGWHWVSADLPPPQTHWWFGDTPEVPRTVPAGFYLDHLLLTDEFAGALQRYQQLHQLSATLDADQEIRGDAITQAHIDALRLRVSVALQNQRRHLEDVAVNELQSQKKQVERYLVEARFALASIYDRPVAEAGQ